MSFHAYAHLTDRYILLPHGASMGDRYGPVVVAKKDGPTSLEGIRVAVPGELTTAFLALRNQRGTALVAVRPEDPALLFSAVAELRVLSGPTTTVWIDEPAADVGNASSLAAARLAVDRHA